MAAFQQHPSATLPLLSTTHRFLPQTANPCALTSWVLRGLIDRSTPHPSETKGRQKWPSAPRRLNSGQHPAAMAINTLFPADHPSPVQLGPFFASNATSKLSPWSLAVLPSFQSSLKTPRPLKSFLLTVNESVSHASSSVARCQ
ncbi:hypothetical protein N7468_002891 [Penicillium chermesinum]|uniref:Uncharacterized protein n=1 Tax=Penicillium chermesinum TaxID=63820 RepID=A0A9W9P869_9EURO|nr:uncharacterized protein N7468_002891 [Penicillium chermesinum]KAJ5238272.1 hypothetical protein N7468_002891 [Penicillium chermesinum]